MSILSFLYPKEFIQVAMLSTEIKYVNDYTVKFTIPTSYLSVCLQMLSKCKDYDIKKIEEVNHKHAILALYVDYSSTLISELECLCEELIKIGIRIKLKH